MNWEWNLLKETVFVLFLLFPNRNAIYLRESVVVVVVFVPYQLLRNRKCFLMDGWMDGWIAGGSSICSGF